MYVPRLMVFDPDDYTASVLQDMLSTRGFVAPVVREESLLHDETIRHRPDVLVFNFHYGRHATLETFIRLRETNRPLATMALAAPGAAIRDLRDWIARTGAIDTVVEKPLTDESFDAALDEMKRLLAQRAASAPPQDRATSSQPASARLVELAVLATDLRRKVDAPSRLHPSAYFGGIAALLAEQTGLIREAQGTVLRRSGGGLLATFSGAARAHLALRCSMKLLSSQPVEEMLQAAHFGIGVSSGLALAGFLGNGSGVRYDIAGATVDLALSLARRAGPGRILTDAATLSSARLPEVSCEVRRIDEPGYAGEEAYSIAVTTPALDPAGAHSLASGGVR
jgi:class 3 adenylate cyclase